MFITSATNCSVLCFHAAHYEKLNFQLSKQYILDPMTGLLLVYPSCLLHVIEVSSLPFGDVTRDIVH